MIFCVILNLCLFVSNIKGNRIKILSCGVYQNFSWQNLVFCWALSRYVFTMCLTSFVPHAYPRLADVSCSMTMSSSSQPANTFHLEPLPMVFGGFATHLLSVLAGTLHNLAASQTGFPSPFTSRTPSHRSPSEYGFLLL